MLSRIIINPVFSILILTGSIVTFYSCQTAVIIPIAKNSMTGSVDGTTFTASGVNAILDTSGNYILTATINTDATLSLYFKDENVELHPVQTGGAFLDFISTLDSLVAIQPPIEDSLILDSLALGLVDLLGSVDDPLAPDKSFLFYIIGDFIYYAESGNFRLTDYDRELNRFSGEIDMGLVNFSQGRKELHAILEDIQIIE